MACSSSGCANICQEPLLHCATPQCAIVSCEGIQLTEWSVRTFAAVSCRHVDHLQQQNSSSFEQLHIEQSSSNLSPASTLQAACRQLLCASSREYIVK
jgi:hypothetical protein